LGKVDHVISTLKERKTKRVAHEALLKKQAVRQAEVEKSWTSMLCCLLRMT